MSVEAFSWALTVPIGGNAKICLLGLANHAHPDGTETYPALDTLAAYAHCDRSTARRNVRKLVAEGWAIEDGLGPKGQAKYRLPLWRDEGRPKAPPKTPGGKTPPVASEADGGGDQGVLGVALLPPEPSREPSSEPSSSSGSASAKTDRADQAPDGFPDALRPHARIVMRILRDAAAQQPAARAVRARSVGLALMGSPRKPVVAAAYAYAGWLADHPESERKDVVAGYRRWLSKERDLAATERLDGDAPGGSAERPANVTPLHGRGGARERAMSESERMDAEEAAAIRRLRGGA